MDSQVIPRSLSCARIAGGRKLRCPGLKVIFVWLLVSLALLCGSQTGDPLREHYEAATRFIRAGDQSHASVEYRAFLAEAMHRIANGQADSGEFNSALISFDQALQFSPDDVSSKFDYAKACLDADKLPKAKSLAEAVAKANPTPETRLLFGRVLFHLGEFEPAREQLEWVFSQKPEFNTGYLLGKVYLLIRQESKARTLFNEMAKQFGDTPQIHLFFGRAYSESDHPDEAIAEFRRAMEEDERAPDIHYYLGLTYLGHNESAGYAKAIPEFRAELERNKNDFRSHYMLGYVAAKQRNYSEAETELKAALELQSQDVQSLLQLAGVYTETNWLPEAEASLRRVLSIISEDPGAESQAGRTHYLLGRLLERTGRRDEAQREMKIVSEIQKRVGPSSMQTEETRTSNLARKEAVDEPKRFASPAEQAKLKQLNEFENTLRPAIADAYNNLGVIAAGGRDFPASANYFLKAKEWDPTFEGLDRNLGRAEFFAGQFDRAVQPLSTYLQQHPDDNSVRSILGLTLFRLGDYQKVVEVLSPIESAIQSNPELSNAYATSRSKIGK